MRGALVALALAACGGGRAPTAPVVEDRFEGSLSPPPAKDAEVVARVNGEQIYVADVIRHATEKQVGAREALEELIALELLAGEARRRGLADHPEVVETRRKERVRRFVDTAFAPTFDGPEDVPDAEVDRVWEHPTIQAYYNHEVHHDVYYVQITLDRDKATPEEEASAREAAEAVYRATTAARPATAQAFLDLALAEAQKTGWKAKPYHYPTSRHGMTVEEFASAAFSIDEPGEISRPARTAWGWDVLYLDKIIPARKTTKEEAAPEIRARRFEIARRDAFVAWVRRFESEARVVRHDAQLERLVEPTPTPAAAP